MLNEEVSNPAGGSPQEPTKPDEKAEPATADPGRERVESEPRWRSHDTSLLDESPGEREPANVGPVRHEPMPPVLPGEAHAAIERPKAVDNAFWASIASTAIASVATIVTVLLDSVWLERFARAMLADSGRRATAADLATTISVARVSLGFGVALFAAIFVLFAVKMRAGRGWARILLTVFAALGVLNFLSAVASTGAALSLMWSLAEIAFSVTSVLYMFRPESSKYFLEHRKRRLARRGRRLFP